MHSLDVPQKRCKGPCDAKIPLYRFGRDASAPDGHKRRCRECENAYSKALYHSKIVEFRHYHKLYQRKRRAKAHADDTGTV